MLSVSVATPAEKKYQFYYPHQSRDSVSLYAGFFFTITLNYSSNDLFVKKSYLGEKKHTFLWTYKIPNQVSQGKPFFLTCHLVVSLPKTLQNITKYYTSTACAAWDVIISALGVLDKQNHLHFSSTAVFVHSFLF